MQTVQFSLVAGNREGIKEPKGRRPTLDEWNDILKLMPRMSIDLCLSLTAVYQQIRKPYKISAELEIEFKKFMQCALLQWRLVRWGQRYFVID